MKTRTQDPLGPLNFVVGVLASLMVLPLVVLAPLATFLDGWMVFGFGDDSVCVESDSVSWDLRGADTYFEGLAPGVQALTGSVRLCQGSAPTSQQLLESGTMLVPYLLFLGFLALAWWILLGARKHGLFAAGVATRVTLLGWYLTVGSIVSAALVCVLTDRLVLGMAPNSHPSWMRAFDFPWAVVIAGLCTITVGRVLAHAVRMQREVDTLV